MAQAYRRILFVMLGLILAFGLLIAIDLAMVWFSIPPTHVVDIQSYLHWQSHAGDFVPIEVDGKRYYMTYGGGMGMMSSGPSAYVFGSNGKKVDWSRDIGDDDLFNNKWKAQKRRSAPGAIPADQILKQLPSPDTQPKTAELPG